MKFSQFASANMLLTSGANILVSLIVGRVLDRSGHNYRLTFVFSFVLSIATLAVMWNVYRKFMSMGGPSDYVAPEPSAA